MTGFHKLGQIGSKAFHTSTLVVGLAAVLLGCAGCAHTPQTEAAPPPRADAHPLPPVQGKQQRPALPTLPGDTRPHPAAPGP